MEGHRHDPRGRAACSASRWSATRARTSTSRRSAASTRRRRCSRWGAGSRASASPGLESLACGTPLVTTDNGGCREYAIDGETALVVPPRDARAMADAIRRLLDDDALAARSSPTGSRSSSATSTGSGAPTSSRRCSTACAPARRRRRRRRDPPPRPQPELSVVVLAWDNLLYTQQFVESVRRNTDVPYELVIVDNGSAWEAANYAARGGRSGRCSTTTNLGFARGMNQGLAAARGRYVAFCNNDTRAAARLGGAPRRDRALPSERGDRRSRRSPRRAIRSTSAPSPATTIEVLPPFSAPPAAIVYVMPGRRRARGSARGERSTRSRAAKTSTSCFKVWVNDLDIVYDQRVLVQHVGQGHRVAARRLAGPVGAEPPALPRQVDGRRRGAAARRRATRSASRATARPPVRVAGWMERYFSVRDREDRRNRRFFAKNGPVRTHSLDWAHAGWRRVRPAPSRPASPSASARPGHVPGRVAAHGWHGLHGSVIARRGVPRSWSGDPSRHRDRAAR